MSDQKLGPKQRLMKGERKKGLPEEEWDLGSPPEGMLTLTADAYLQHKY